MKRVRSNVTYLTEAKIDANKGSSVAETLLEVEMIVAQAFVIVSAYLPPSLPPPLSRRIPNVSLHVEFNRTDALLDEALCVHANEL